jgi:cytochrome d ubiquinol oxidase subunit I
VFWAFRAMVGIGFVMLAIAVTAAWLWWRGRLFDARAFLKPVGYSWPLGFLAILAGWFTTEIGRQPWVAYGLVRTVDAVSPVAAVNVAISLALFVSVYCVVFGVGVWYIRKLLAKGPDMSAGPQDAVPTGPLAAARDDVRESKARGAKL